MRATKWKSKVKAKRAELEGKLAAIEDAKAKAIEELEQERLAIVFAHQILDDLLILDAADTADDVDATDEELQELDVDDTDRREI